MLPLLFLKLFYVDKKLEWNTLLSCNKKLTLFIRKKYKN